MLKCFWTISREIFWSSPGDSFCEFSKEFLSGISSLEDPTLIKGLLTKDESMTMVYSSDPAGFSTSTSNLA